MNPELIQQINAALQQGYSLSTVPSLLTTYDQNEVKHAIESYIDFHAKQIDQFTRQMVQQGYHFDQIKQTFLQKGYDPMIVDKSLSHVSNDEQLEMYVKQLLAQGYSLERIHSLLIDRHYDLGKVNKVMRHFNQSQFHFSKQTVFAVLVLIVTFGGMFAYLSLRDNQRLLDVSASPLDSEKLSPGSEVQFTVEALNLGGKGTYDVIFKYSLRDITNTLIEERSTTKAIATSLNFIDTFELPKTMKDGKYYVEIEADYVDGVAKSEFSIAVMNQKESSNSNTQNITAQGSSSDNAEIGTSTETSSSGSSRQNTNVPFVPEIILPKIPANVEEGHIVEGTTTPSLADPNVIESLAKQDLSFAYYVCSKLDAGERDSCFERAGIPTVQSLLDSGLCERIVVYSGQEICITNQTEEPSDICDIDNPSIRAECDLLAVEYDGVMEIALSGDVFEGSDYVPAPTIVYPENKETTAISDYE